MKKCDFKAYVDSKGPNQGLQCPLTKLLGPVEYDIKQNPDWTAQFIWIKDTVSLGVTCIHRDYDMGLSISYPISNRDTHISLRALGKSEDHNGVAFFLKRGSF